MKLGSRVQRQVIIFSAEKGAAVWAQSVADSREATRLRTLQAPQLQEGLQLMLLGLGAGNLLLGVISARSL